MQITVHDMQDGYIEIVKEVVRAGRKKAPRGLPTRDVPSASIILLNPTRALPVGIGRRVSSRLGAVEALSLIGGFCDPQLLMKASTDMARFSEGGNFFGGYGQRIRGQMITVIKRLITDPDTRQAQVVVWDPSYDALVPDALDYPCTTSLQFIITEGHLELHVHMRSNDVWRGLSLDAFMFTQLQLAVAGFLGIPYGPYYHHASSLHIYESDLPSVDDLHPPDRNFSLNGLFRSWVGDPSVEASWLRVTRVVRDHLRIGNDEVKAYDFDSTVLNWYMEKLR